MTKRTIVSTTHAPAAIGPYSQAVSVGDWVFLSGQNSARLITQKETLKETADEMHRD